MARPIPQEVRDQLIALCVAGRTLREAATVVGVSENAASKYLRRAGVDVGDGRFPPALAGKDLTQLIAAYNTGATLEEAGKPFNLSVSTVRGILLRAGIKTRSSLEAARQQIAAPELLPPGRAMTPSEYGLRRNRRLRQEVVRSYGGICECCQETAWEFLTIDHVEGDGQVHRAGVAEAAGEAQFYRALKKLGWPRDGLRLLCYNCNLGRQRFGGTCPHIETPHAPEFTARGHQPARHLCSKCTAPLPDERRNSLCRPCAAAYMRENRALREAGLILPDTLKGQYFFRQCYRCLLFKSRRVAFYGKSSQCKTCAKEWQNKNRAYLLLGDARRRWDTRVACLLAYGGKCVCCQSDDLSFLTLDHAEGDGAAARRAGEESGNRLYRRLEQEGFPQGRFRTLCFNCNCSRGHLGYCPHERPA